MIDVYAMIEVPRQIPAWWVAWLGFGLWIDPKLTGLGLIVVWFVYASAQ